MAPLKSSLRTEPIMKLRICLEISSYSKHDPRLECRVMQSWLDWLVDSQQKDIALKTTTADTGTAPVVHNANYWAVITCQA